MIRVMEEMGWGADGGFIPIANEANRKLLEYVNKLAERKGSVAGRVQASDTRFGNLQVHLKSAQLEFDQNLKLLAEDKCQIDAEHGRLKLTENEGGRMRKMAREVQYERGDLEQHDQRAQSKRIWGHLDGCNSCKMSHNHLFIFLLLDLIQRFI